MSLAIDINAQLAPASLAGLTIRPFNGSDADYAAVAAVGNAVAPEYPDSVEEIKHNDAARPAHIVYRRFVAELDGVAVGVASFGQMLGMYHPQKFSVYAGVIPSEQGRGIGRALYATLLQQLAPLDPLSLRTNLREDGLRAMRFLRERGFVEDRRAWESRLDVTSFDPAPFAGQEERVLAQGLRLVTLSELIANDPEHRRKLYELDVEATHDEPMPEPFTPPAQEDYDRYIFDNPDLRPDGFFVALDGERYAGLSSLFGNQAEPSTLSVGFTGVGRDYRRRGIALALKLRALNYAKRQGVRTIKTWNDSTNRAMLSINEALGFAKQPAWVNLVKKLSDEV